MRRGLCQLARYISEHRGNGSGWDLSRREEGGEEGDVGRVNWRRFGGLRDVDIDVDIDIDIDMI